MFRKRVAKIEEVQLDNPHWKVELRKRLLQTAALSVAMLALIDRVKLEEVNPNIPSNLPQFTEKVQAFK